MKTTHAALLASALALTACAGPAKETAVETSELHEAHEAIEEVEETEEIAEVEAPAALPLVRFYQIADA